MTVGQQRNVLPAPAGSKVLIPAKPSKMRLDAVTAGKIKKPIVVTVYGPEGVGKSSLAAGAPNPIFVGAEDGTAQLDVKRFPTPETWEDVREVARVLTRDPHDYQTVVYDTLDWIEPLLWAELCKRSGVSLIEDVGGGYGKWVNAALDEWRIFLADLERLMKTRGMNIILLAHSHVKTYKNPTGEDFDRYTMKMQDKAAGTIREWSEAVLFANYETFAKKMDPKDKRAKGFSSGARMLYSERHAAYDAKNRYNLPDELPLSWADLAAAIERGAVAPPEVLLAEITERAKLLGELEATIMQTATAAGDDAVQLAKILNRVEARIAEKGL